jgi:hypothetical protein
VWICAECNEIVEHPVKGQCPHGHALYDRRIFGPTKAISFSRALWYGFMSGIAGAAILAVLQRFFMPSLFQGTAVIFILALPILALIALLRGLKWRRQGGPIASLAPRAFGIAAGWTLFAAMIAVVGFLESRGWR